MATEETSEAGTAVDEAPNTFTWSDLPNDAQHNVLSRLGVRDLCRMRCVCREWRDVVHRREFRSLYDAVHSSHDADRSPVMCYMESSYPVHLQCCAYDYESRTWKKMSGAFPSLRPSALTALNVRVQQHWPLNASLHSARGLLFLHRWQGENSTWTVWNPFRNRWKKLPPCKNRVGPFFVHAFVSDKAYKILMARERHRNDVDDGRFDAEGNYVRRSIAAEELTLATEIYDSATGVWTAVASHRLRSAHLRSSDSVRGVLCNGVIYFAHSSVLLSYDVAKDEWREEISDGYHPELFEWDGVLMALKVDAVTRDVGPGFVEWDPAVRLWRDSGVEIPRKILDKFRYFSEGFSIVASGNYLAVTGYCVEDDGFRIAVYRRAENFWRVPPSGAFSDKLRPARVEGLVLFAPALDRRP